MEPQRPWLFFLFTRTTRPREKWKGEKPVQILHNTQSKRQTLRPLYTSFYSRRQSAVRLLQQIQSYSDHLYPVLKHSCPDGSGIFQNDSAESPGHEDSLNGLMRMKMVYSCAVSDISNPRWSLLFWQLVMSLLRHFMLLCFSP